MESKVTITPNILQGKLESMEIRILQHNSIENKLAKKQLIGREEENQRREEEN